MLRRVRQWRWSGRSGGGRAVFGLSRAGRGADSAEDLIEVAPLATGKGREWGAGSCDRESRYGYETLRTDVETLVCIRGRSDWVVVRRWEPSAKPHARADESYDIGRPHTRGHDGRETNQFARNLALAEAPAAGVERVAATRSRQCAGRPTNRPATQRAERLGRPNQWTGGRFGPGVG